jgi:hypothetical protein
LIENFLPNTWRGRSHLALLCIRGDHLGPILAFFQASKLDENGCAPYFLMVALGYDCDPCVSSLLSAVYRYLLSAVCYLLPVVICFLLSERTLPLAGRIPCSRASLWGSLAM